ncbi:MAG TPA: galactokinase, partial [Clostridiales bacterium]|nr:galactokinase [Clostridiales bacterium]
CGLMDQMACAVGGFVEIDFRDPADPVIEKIDFDLTGKGYDLCIVNTGGNHADLNEDYAAIPAEMKAVAKLFGQEVLRGISEEELLQRAPEIREKAGDRALLRALHFVKEDARIPEIAQAMKKGDLPAFLAGIRASGESSFKYLQNVFSSVCPKEQGETLALYVAEKALNSYPVPGACRVHGGGFAG